MMAIASNVLDTEGLTELVFARMDVWPLLLLAPAVVLAYSYGAFRRRESLRALGNPVLVARLVSTVHHGRRLLHAVITTLVLCLLALALMRPQYGGTAKVVPASGLDVVLVVDYSKSMLAKDVYPSRSARIAAELTRFLEDAGKRGDRVGLVVFAGAARGLPVTRDVRLLSMYLQHADPRTENPGGTAIGKALKLALTFLVDARSETDAAQDAHNEPQTSSDPHQAIILLTDGEDTGTRPLEVAAEAARLAVPIYSVGIGSRSGEPVQKFDGEGNPDGYQTDDSGNYVMTRLDEQLLETLAKSTGARYIPVDTERFGLDEVRNLLDKLSSERRRDRVEVHRQEGFHLVAGPALLLIAISLALAERRRRV